MSTCDTKSYWVKKARQAGITIHAAMSAAAIKSLVLGKTVDPNRSRNQRTKTLQQVSA